MVPMNYCVHFVYDGGQRQGCTYVADEYVAAFTDEAFLTVMRIAAGREAEACWCEPPGTVES